MDILEKLPATSSQAALSTQFANNLAVWSGAPTGNSGQKTLTRAQNDTEAVVSWLVRYQDSKNTFDAYRREAERFLLWCTDRQIALADVMTEDVLAYQEFLRQPAAKFCQQTIPRYLDDGTQNPAWKSLKRVPQYLADGSANPEWRPFISGLSPSAANQAMTVLFGCFEYLCTIGYLAANPFRAVKTRSRKPRKKAVERYFDQDLWQLILTHLETWPRDTTMAEAHYQRNRFLLSFLYLTGLRRSEMAQATTADLKLIRGQWWLNVIGKGNLDADVPLPTDALNLLIAYRESTGRPGWPEPGKTEPLVMDIYGKGRPVTAKAIHQILTHLFETAAQSCGNPYQAETLRAASAHWLRHTAATHQLEAGIPLLIVRDNLRHASVQTTEKYLHQERIRQHHETEKHRLR